MDMLFFTIQIILNYFGLTSHGFLITILPAIFKFWTATWINAREKGNLMWKRALHSPSLLETIGMLENENCETLTALFPLGQISYEFFADMYCFSYAIELMMPFWHNFIVLIIFTFMGARDIILLVFPVDRTSELDCFCDLSILLYKDETLTALFPLGQISYEFFADMYCFSYAIELMMPFWHNFIVLIIFTFMGARDIILLVFPVDRTSELDCFCDLSILLYKDWEGLITLPLFEVCVVLPCTNFAYEIFMFVLLLIGQASIAKIFLIALSLRMIFSE
ncbi:hypothetical protein ACJX0J_039254, partial [Zea mays]